MLNARYGIPRYRVGDRIVGSFLNLKNITSILFPAQSVIQLRLSVYQLAGGVSEENSGVVIIFIAFQAVAKQVIHINGQKENAKITAFPGAERVDGHGKDVTECTVDRGDAG